MWTKWLDIPDDLAPLLGDHNNGTLSFVPRQNTRDLVVVPAARDLPVGFGLPESVVAFNGNGEVYQVASPFGLGDLMAHYEMSVLRSKMRLRSSTPITERPVHPVYKATGSDIGVLVTSAPGLVKHAAWSVVDHYRWSTSHTGSASIPGINQENPPQFVTDGEGKYFAIAVQPYSSSGVRRPAEVMIWDISCSPAVLVGKIEGINRIWFDGDELHILRNTGTFSANYEHFIVSVAELVAIARAKGNLGKQYQQAVKSKMRVAGGRLDRLPTWKDAFVTIPIADIGMVVTLKGEDGGVVPALFTSNGRTLHCERSLSRMFASRCKELSNVRLIERLGADRVRISGCCAARRTTDGYAFDLFSLESSDGVLVGSLSEQLVPQRFVDFAAFVSSFGFLPTGDVPKVCLLKDGAIWTDGAV